MDSIKFITSRRSIRRFEDKAVSTSDVKQILEAAMSAPSAYNHQPWEFIILTDRKVLDRVGESAPFAQVAGAPVAILVCGNFHKENDESFLIESCSTATENMLIAANALGLGSVWTSIYPFEDAIEYFRNIFELPEHILPLVVVPIGYPNYKPRDTVRYDENKIHHNSW